MIQVQFFEWFKLTVAIYCTRVFTVCSRVYDRNILSATPILWSTPHSERCWGRGSPFWRVRNVLAILKNRCINMTPSETLVLKRTVIIWKNAYRSRYDSSTDIHLSTIEAMVWGSMKPRLYDDHCMTVPTDWDRCVARSGDEKLVVFGTYHNTLKVWEIVEEKLGIGHYRTEYNRLNQLVAIDSNV